MAERMEGACHCGAVKVTVPGDAFGVVACHCGDCQKLHGSFFAMLAADRADVRFSGEESIAWYDSSPKARRSFCSKCGSRIAKDPHGSPKLLVSVGLFDRHAFSTVKRNVMPESKPDWYEPPHVAG